MPAASITSVPSPAGKFCPSRSIISPAIRMSVWIGWWTSPSWSYTRPPRIKMRGTAPELLIGLLSDFHGPRRVVGGQRDGTDALDHRATAPFFVLEPSDCRPQSSHNDARPRWACSGGGRGGQQLVTRPRMGSTLELHSEEADPWTSMPKSMPSQQRLQMR